MSDETARPLRQCADCGGVTTKGAPSGHFKYGNIWMCIWCIDGWEGWPRVGDWHPPKEDDRTFPEGRWATAFGGDADVERKRIACVQRGCAPEVTP